jgi:translation initiation factor 1 (eIF-1/SUI1)
MPRSPRVRHACDRRCCARRTFADPYITERNGRKTLTTVQGLPKKFDQKKILKVIKKKFGMSTTNTSPSPKQRLTATSLQWHHRQ